MKKQILLSFTALLLFSFPSFGQEPEIYQKIQALTDQVSTDRLKAGIENWLVFTIETPFPIQPPIPKVSAPPEDGS